jgi:hypothetical protein
MKEREQVDQVRETNQYDNLPCAFGSMTLKFVKGKILLEKASSESEGNQSSSILMKSS